VTAETIGWSGVPDADRQNIDHVARRVGDVCTQMDVDILMLDVTGSGQFAPAAIREQFSGRVVPFNFSDKKKVRDSFVAMNRELRSGSVSVPGDEKLLGQLESIVREQKKDSAVPTFSGKETAPEGKDDMAIATVLALFPPGYAGDRNTDVASKEYPDVAEEVRQPTRGVAQKTQNGRSADAVFGATRVNRSSARRRYRPRRPR
jgi:hypothetical protein